MVNGSFWVSTVFVFPQIVKSHFVEDLKNIPTDILIDMLAQHTLKYTRMFNEGASKEVLANYEYLITFIQTEITYRWSSMPQKKVA